MMRNLFQSQAMLAVLVLMSSTAWAEDRAPLPPTVDLKTAAERGDAQAALRLGDRYGSGQGAAKDNNEAFRWYQKAAELGNAQAKSRLGDAYQFGRGVQIDYIAAAQWYETALAANDGHAAYQLGRMAEIGRGEKSQEAAKYYNRAVALNDPEAMLERAYRLLYETGEIPPDMQKTLTAVDENVSSDAMGGFRPEGITGKWECAVKSNKYLKLNVVIENVNGTINSSYETLRMDLGKTTSTIKAMGSRIVDTGEFSPGMQSRAIFNVLDTAPYKYETEYYMQNRRYLYADNVPFSGKSGKKLNAICRKTSEQDGSLLNY